jgi:hypothetical protein
VRRWVCVTGVSLTCRDFATNLTKLGILEIKWGVSSEEPRIPRRDSLLVKLRPGRLVSAICRGRLERVLVWHRALSHLRSGASRGIVGGLEHHPTIGHRGLGNDCRSPSPKLPGALQMFTCDRYVLCPQRSASLMMIIANTGRRFAHPRVVHGRLLTASGQQGNLSCYRGDPTGA